MRNFADCTLSLQQSFSSSSGKATGLQKFKAVHVVKKIINIFVITKCTFSMKSRRFCKKADTN
jgi:hypothetical protein